MKHPTGSLARLVIGERCYNRCFVTLVTTIILASCHPSNTQLSIPYTCTSHNTLRQSYIYQRRTQSYFMTLCVFSCECLRLLLEGGRKLLFFLLFLNTTCMSFGLHHTFALSSFLCRLFTWPSCRNAGGCRRVH